MRSLHMCCSTALSIGLFAACGGGMTESGSRADYALAVSADSAARGEARSVTQVDVKAIDAAGHVVAEHAIALRAGSTVRVEGALPPGAYMFRLEAFSDEAHAMALGTAVAEARLEAAADTQLKAALRAGQSGNVDVSFVANLAPIVDDVAVTAAAAGEASAHVTLTAHDPEGGALRFFWSGAGIEGTVEGSARVDLAAAVLASGGQEVRALVQDAEGATTNVRVLFAGAGGKVDVEGDAELDGHVDAKAMACLDAHASCVARCDLEGSAGIGGASLKAACLTTCGLALATCDAK